MFDEQKVTWVQIQEIIRQAEARLSAQLQTALAADQRAMTFSGIVGSASVAAFAGAGGLFFFESPKSPAFFYGVLVLAVILLVSAGLAAWSARSAKWEFVGNSPSHWIDDVKDGKSLRVSLVEMAEHYDEMIISNRKSTFKNKKIFNSAFFIALFSCPIAMCVSGTVFYFFSG